MHLLNIAHDIFLIPHSEVGVGSSVFLAADDMPTSLSIDFTVALRLMFEFRHGRPLRGAGVTDYSNSLVGSFAPSGFDVTGVPGATK